MTAGRIPSMTPEQLIARHGGRHPNGYPIMRRHPKPPSMGVVMPQSVADDEIAKQFWEFYTGTVAEDHFANQDIGLLALLCEAHAMHELVRTAWEVEREEKGMDALLIEGKPNPLIAMVRAARQEVVAHARTLCLVPAERNRVVPADAFRGKGKQDKPKGDELFD